MYILFDLTSLFHCLHWRVLIFPWISKDHVVLANLSQVITHFLAFSRKFHEDILLSVSAASTTLTSFLTSWELCNGGTSSYRLDESGSLAAWHLTVVTHGARQQMTGPSQAACGPWLQLLLVYDNTVSSLCSVSSGKGNGFPVFLVREQFIILVCSLKPGHTSGKCPFTQFCLD